MFRTNDVNKNESWRELARNGDLIQAIKVYRELTGEGLRESKQAVDAWIAAQPEGVCKKPIYLSDDEALALTLSTARTGAGYELDEEYRRAQKAIEQTASLVNRILDRDTEAKTGPIPPARHIAMAGHHWLHNAHSEIVVMQWQPGEKKWCHSGRVATANSIDTVKWTYIAPCPMPLMDDEQIYLEGLHEELGRQGGSIPMTQRMAQFLREFLYEFRS